jgi:hypothetical protein
MAWIAVAEGTPTRADALYLGETTPQGGTVTGLTSTTATVTYEIAKATYLDSDYNMDDEGAVTTVKMVVNGTAHSNGSVTRALIGMPTIDTLSGYTSSSVDLALACTQNSDSTNNWSVRAYPLTQSWTEGTSSTGGQTRTGAAVNGATWSTSDGTTPWSGTTGTWLAYGGTITGGGGSYNASAYANVATLPVTGSWTTMDLTGIWSQASTDGLLLTDYALNTGVTEDQTQIASSSWVTLKFASDDWTIGTTGLFANQDARPNLTVTYVTVPEPGTMALLASGLGVALAFFGRRRQPRREL